MPKIRIPVEQLPPPNSKGDHVLQFRAVSEDRNRTSALSSLFIIKSTGQYRPEESDYIYRSASPTVSVTWDTPSIYNSGSVVHNHSRDFKRHDTDIFVSWNSDHFEYHDRVNTDNISLVVPGGSASVRIVGTIATHGIPTKEAQESDEDYGARLDAHLENAGGLFDLFKIFDTGTRLVT